MARPRGWKGETSVGVCRSFQTRIFFRIKGGAYYSGGGGDGGGWGKETAGRRIEKGSQVEFRWVIYKLETNRKFESWDSIRGGGFFFFN